MGITKEGDEIAEEYEGSPALDAGLLAEHDQRLADGAGGSLHEHALSGLDPGRAVKQLICGRPTQNQRGRLRRIGISRHTG